MDVYTALKTLADTWTVFDECEKIGKVFFLSFRSIYVIFYVSMLRIVPKQ